jgi:hypothetical protein
VPFAFDLFYSQCTSSPGIRASKNWVIGAKAVGPAAHLRNTYLQQVLLGLGQIPQEETYISPPRVRPPAPPSNHTVAPPSNRTVDIFSFADTTAACISKRASRRSSAVTSRAQSSTSARSPRQASSFVSLFCMYYDRAFKALQDIPTTARVTEHKVCFRWNATFGLSHFYSFLILMPRQMFASFINFKLCSLFIRHVSTNFISAFVS